MPSKAVLSWLNRLDLAAATFTTDSQAGLLLAANLADPRLSLPWRTNGTTAAYVEVDLGAEYPLGLFALAGLTATTTDTVRLRLSTVAAGAGEVLDTTALAGAVHADYGVWVHVEASDLAARYLRWDLSVPSRAAAGYFQVGRAWAGPTWRPARGNYAYPLVETWEDSSTVAIAPKAGTEHVDLGVRRRRLAFQFPMLTDADAYDDVGDGSGGLRELRRIAGVRDQILFVPDPDSTRLAQESYLGRLAQVAPITRAGFDLRSSAFELLESR